MNGEKIPFEGGTVFICSGRRRSRSRCQYCSADSIALCDHPVIRKGKQVTCDRKLCARHRKKIGGDVDLCPAHAMQYELNGNRLAIGDVALDPNREPSAEEKPVRLPTDPREMYQVFKRGQGWLSQKGTNGSRSWIADRSKAQVFNGGAVLDATLRAHKLEAFTAEVSLFSNAGEKRNHG